MRRPLVLASTSPYRRELLSRLRVPFSTAAPDVDEQALPGEAPQALASRLALAKALSVKTAGAVVIGSDQVADLNGQPLGKPLTHERARRQLESSLGREVRFHTAVAVVDTGDGSDSDSDRRLTTVDLTLVRFRHCSTIELEHYLKLERPYDCAGGFKAEGLGITLFEEIRCSDPTALLGLPLIWLAGALRAVGINPLQPDD